MPIGSVLYRLVMQFGLPTNPQVLQAFLALEYTPRNGIKTRAYAISAALYEQLKMCRTAAQAIQMLPGALTVMTNSTIDPETKTVLCRFFTERITEGAKIHYVDEQNRERDLQLLEQERGRGRGGIELWRQLRYTEYLARKTPSRIRTVFSADQTQPQPPPNPPSRSLEKISA